MLIGYLEPSIGKVEIDGRQFVDHHQEILTDICYLHVNCPVYPGMTVVSVS